MVTKRFENLDSEKRESILRAAMIEFGEQGLDGANLQEVAKRAGVAKGLLYYYFENRQDLLSTMFDLGHERIGMILSGAPTYHDADSFWVFVESIYTQAVRGFSVDAWMIPFLLRVMDELTRGKVPQGFEEKKQLTMRLISRTLQDGIRLGALRTDLPDDLLPQAVFAMMRVAERWLFTRIKEGVATEADAQIIRTLLKDSFGVLPSSVSQQ